MKRTETDSLGSVEIDAARYWGPQTERARVLFRIGTERLPTGLIRAIGLQKQAAAEANLAEDGHIRWHRLVGERRDDRSGDREVGGRLADPQAAGHVQIDVVGPDGDAAACLQNGQHHGEAVGIPADDGMARRAEGGGRHQRLDLDQQRPRALDAGEDAGAGDLAAALGEEQGGRVRHVRQAAIRHLEDADLVGRTEAVLHGPQDAELMAALAFEIKHRVDHVLEHTGAGDGAVLGDVADQQDGDAAALGEVDQRLRGAADLRDGAGRAVDRVEPHGLDRIDHRHARRIGGLQRGDDVAHRGRSRELDGGVGEAQALGPQAHLVECLLAGDIGDRHALAREGGRHLQQQRRLADAGVAADQQGRAHHQPAAAGPVEFLDAALVARRLRRGAREGCELDPPSLAAAAEATAGGTGRGGRLLGDGVPFAATLAAAAPAVGDRAAALADEALLGAGHVSEARAC